MLDTGTFRRSGDFPSLGTAIAGTDENVKFLVIERGGENPSLLGLSPFLITKHVNQAVKKIEDTRSEQNGARYVVKVRGERDYQRLLKLTPLPDGTKLVVKEHERLNFCKVVIKAPEIIHMSDDEIKDELKDQSVTEVRRILKKINGVQQPTPSLILTIHKPTAPEYVKIGFLKKVTHTFYPRPTRCFNCWEYGHISNKCNTEKKCRNCGQTWHDEECIRPAYCCLCHQNHPATSPTCSKYKREVEIIKLKVDRDIPFPVARRLYSEQLSSYAEIVNRSSSQNNKPCNCKCLCQAAPAAPNKKTSPPPPSAQNIGSSSNPESSTPKQNSSTTTIDTSFASPSTTRITRNSLKNITDSPLIQAHSSQAFTKQSGGKKSRSNTPVGRNPEKTKDSPVRKKPTTTQYASQPNQRSQSAEHLHIDIDDE